MICYSCQAETAVLIDGVCQGCPKGYKRTKLQFWSLVQDQKGQFSWIGWEAEEVGDCHDKPRRQQTADGTTELLYQVESL